jgi:hypothetical protein
MRDESVIPPAGTRPEIDTAWAEELRRRIRAFRSGEMKAISAEQALAEADRLLAEEPDR